LRPMHVAELIRRVEQVHGAGGLRVVGGYRAVLASSSVQPVRMDAENVRLVKRASA
jgi:hypothetical protein